MNKVNNVNMKFWTAVKIGIGLSVGMSIAAFVSMFIFMTITASAFV